jgi:uncharacterized SAM-binding protein YcdF (DUF218 family)
MCRVFRVAFAVVALAVLCVAITIFAAPDLFSAIWRKALVVRVPMKSADAILLLGGESQGRPLEAARLYHQGVASLVIVVGTGDYRTNKKSLLQEGVPAGAILIEPSSTSTQENALFVRPLLKEAGIQRVLLVTSSFHARRALATFQQLVPDIVFGVAPSRIGWWDTPSGRFQEDAWAAKEFIKLSYYWLVHGIHPWVDQVRAGKDG